MRRVVLVGLATLAALNWISCSGEPKVELVPPAGPNAALDDAFPIEQATGSVLAFTKAVWPVLTLEPNFVFSPLAAVSAIAVLAEGANEAAATELAAAGYLPTNRAKLASGFEVGFRNLPRTPETPSRIRWLNTLALGSGASATQVLVELAEAKYATTLLSTDLSDGAGLLRDIETATGLTPEIPNSLFGSKASLVAASAVSVQGPWLHPFIPRQTREHPFVRAEGDTVSTLGVITVDSLQAGYGVEWLMVELPYLGEELAFYGITPYPGYTLDEVAAMLPDSLNSWIGQMGPHHVAVHAPSFRIRSDYDLMPTLTALGVSGARSEGGALDGLAPDSRLTGFFQTAALEFSTHGSGVSQPNPNPPPRPAGVRSNIFISMDMMRPFLFVVVDTRRNLLTLVGRITDPTLLEPAG